MDYEKAYHKTLEQLFFATGELSREDKQKEVEYAIFTQLSALISDFYSKVDTLQGERKIKAETTLKTLFFVFHNLGQVYLKSLAARKRNFELSKENLFLADRIAELEKELTILKNIDEL